MRPVFLVSALGALILALIYQPQWLSTFIIIGGILAVALGLAILIAAHVSLVVRSNFSTVYTKPTPEHKTIHRYLTVSTHFFFLQYFPYSEKIRVGF
jgi:cytochrome c biogenesis protein CcdA